VVSRPAPQEGYGLVNLPFSRLASSVKRLLIRPLLVLAIVCGVVALGVVLSFPALLAVSIQRDQNQAIATIPEQFPVTVNPRAKTIVENVEVNAFLEGADSPLQATALTAGSMFGYLFTWIATAIADAPWYQSIAAVNGRFVTITSGMRKEQVASAFASTLAWNKNQKQEFVTAKNDALLPLPEGSFSPGTYFVSSRTTPAAAQTLVNDRFTREVLSRYGTTTAAVVPLAQALTVASLIERETGGPDDMRLISGIIWNRLFLNMNLQIDATLQYVKASNTVVGNWWPGVVPADRYRKSVYNTYLHSGLPPTPIASPSVAAIIAALNPKNTPCIYYFHDRAGGFHCTTTYAEHVALLKKYYGRGK